MPALTPESGRLSPTFLATFLGCTTSAAWTLEKRRGLRSAPEAIVDPQAGLVQRKGQEHEDRCLAALREQYGGPVVIGRGSPEQAMRATRAAMDDGAPLIAQAALVDGPWIGYADFLVRVETACPSWAWSYEPWDAKLAHTAQPAHVLQIALYGDLLARVQGCVAEHGTLMLGSGDPAVPHVTERFRLAEVRHYVRRAARRLERFAADTPIGLEGEPCGHCGKCEWGGTCEDAWTQADHLCRVADISRRQRQRLMETGVSTLTLLGALEADRVPGIGTETLVRLVQQARLQRQSEDEERGVHELLAHAPGLGFDRLPQPHPDDLFFDFEGDPMHPGGLEYLCGVLWRGRPDDTEGTPVPGHPGLRFLAVWAHDRAQEKQAFTEVMAFLTRRLSGAPGAHLYHYAPYEKTALRRLASMHAVAAVARALPLGGADGSGILTLGRKDLRAGQMVGVLAAEGCALEILPKIGDLDEGGTRRQLVHMLAVTHDLDVSAGALSELDWQRDDLLEILIRLFARMLTEAVRRGMPRRYVGHEDDLPVLRGRLDVARQFTRLATSPQFLACRFDALSADIALNRIMKAAVLRLQPLARTAETRRTLTELAFAYADIREVPVEALRFDDVILDRTNARWRDLLALARLLLLGRFQTTSGGAATGFSLLFAMNALFEAYVARMLARALRGSGQRVVAQGGLLYCLEDSESGIRRFRTKPDILVKRNSETTLVIDTKWKHLAPIIDDPKQGVSQSDIYQMIAYGQLYHCARLLLLYPHHAQIGTEPGLCSRHRIVSSDDELFVGTLDLKQLGTVPKQLSVLASVCCRA